MTAIADSIEGHALALATMLAEMREQVLSYPVEQARLDARDLLHHLLPGGEHITAGTALRFAAGAQGHDAPSALAWITLAIDEIEAETRRLYESERSLRLARETALVHKRAQEHFDRDRELAEIEAML
jgi:hypothetical protein